MRRLAIALLLATGCATSGPVPPAPAPRRPPPEKLVKTGTQEDCKPVVPEELPSAVPYEQRSRMESANLSATASKMLGDAFKAGVGAMERERMITDAVADLVTALKADPYNVTASYALAAAYSRIGRKQCALNLLERLSNLRRLNSFNPEVEAKIDKLLGRNQYKGALDHDFDDMRGDDNFRDLVKELVKPL